MFKTTFTVFVLIVVATVTWLGESLADKRTLIRFYKTINEEGQERALMMVKNDDQPGCHTVNSRRKASRIAVMGFEYCEIFAEPDCADGSKMNPLWAKKKKKDQKLIDRAKDGRLTQGTRWMLGTGDNISFRSFRCQLEP